MEKKILVVDDALFMRTMLKRILNEAGFADIVEAADGEAGCAAYEETHPDMVLLDISMPKMNGIDALKAIRKGDPDAKIVMCSAVGQEAMIIEAIENGAADFIVKPFKKEKIVEAVKKMLGVTEEMDA